MWQSSCGQHRTARILDENILILWKSRSYLGLNWTRVNSLTWDYRGCIWMDMWRRLLIWPLQQSCSFLFTLRHVLVCVCTRACPRLFSFCVSLCHTSSQCFQKQLLWPTPRQQHYKSSIQTSKVCFITSPSWLTLVEVSVILWLLVWNQFPSLAGLRPAF